MKDEKKWWDDDQDLPPGKTCLACVSFKLCQILGVAKPNHVWCDWAPSRFREKETEVTAQ